MATKKAVENEIETVGTLKNLIVTYEEIAANNMRRIRNSVVKKRDFLSEINKLYNEVRASYKKELERILKSAKSHHKVNFSFIKHNNKTALVFLSANASLYGTIVKQTFTLFNDQFHKHNGEPIIIGRIGKQLFETANPGIGYTYFDLSDSMLDIEALRDIVVRLVEFEKVIIFHGQFQSLLTQKPQSYLLSGGDNIAEVVENKIKYFFEPNLDKIMEFFEKEIFASLFEQAIHESELAKFASRMISLEQASENIKTNLKNLGLEKRILLHQEINKKQQGTVTAIYAWRKRI